MRTVKTRTLEQDIERGVKHLSEQSYSTWYGATTSSEEFTEYVLSHFDVGTVVRVVFTQTNKHHYTVTFFTDKGYTILTKGFSFGYYGQGTRAVHKLLHNLGFSKRQINKVFQRKSDFQLYKRAA